MEQDKRIVEINGIKVEVDLSSAKVVATYKIGDPVKVLKKKWSNDWQVLPGVIVGFDCFQKMPTMTIAAIDPENGALEFVYFNSSKTENFDIAPANVKELKIQRSHVVEILNREVNKTEAAAADARNKLQYFTDMFGCYFQSEESKETA